MVCMEHPDVHTPSVQETPQLNLVYVPARRRSAPVREVLNILTCLIIIVTSIYVYVRRYYGHRIRLYIHEFLRKLWAFPPQGNAHPAHLRRMQ